MLLDNFFKLFRWKTRQQKRRQSERGRIAFSLHIFFPFNLNYYDMNLNFYSLCFVHICYFLFIHTRLELAFLSCENLVAV